VKAIKVVYDPAKKRVVYNGARIELFGLPLIPLPFLSHPVDTKAGSGFLVPSIGFSRNNGVELEQAYYWRIADNRDASAAITAFSNAAPLARVNFRSLEKKGAIDLSAYGTYSNRISTSGALRPDGDNVFRGYLEGAGKFQFDPYWSISASGRRHFLPNASVTKAIFHLLGGQYKPFVPATPRGLLPSPYRNLIIACASTRQWWVAHFSCRQIA
jgi:LPS-assembly protein